MTKDMYIVEIEKLREILNNMIESESYTFSEILKASQNLDVLIVNYYRETS